MDETTAYIFDKIDEELKRAEKKHPGWPSDPIHASAIINEEAGELTQACIDFVYDPDIDSEEQKKKMFNEVIQIGAMAVRFAVYIGAYRNVAALNHEILRLRTALVALVGADDPEELQEMESTITAMPVPDEEKAAILNAIRILMGGGDAIGRDT